MAGNLFSGLAEGLASGQSIKARRNNDALQQQQLAIQNKTLDLKTQEFEQEKQMNQMKLDAAKGQAALKDGLNQAFSTGGYEGAMDYLKHEDMDMYMAVQKGKAEVDKSISDAASSKYTSEKDKQETVKNGWMILGRFGASLQKIPAEERAQAYQQMLPVIQSIYPDAPKAYDDKTQTLMTVAMGVSMPDSQLYGAQKAAARSQTAIGKIQNDIMKLKDQGLPDSDPSLVALQTQLKVEISNNTEAQLDAAKNAPGEDALRNQYVNLNKNFMAIRDQWTQLKDYSDKNATPMGDMKLIYAFNKMMNPNDSVKEGEFANTTNAAGWSDKARNEYNKALKGNLMSSNLRNDMLSQGSKLYDGFKTNYEGMKSQFTDLAVRRGLNPKNVVLDLDVQNSGANASAPPPDWIQQVKALNPGYSDADAAAAWEYSQKQKSAQSPQQSAAPEMQPQMDNQDQAVAQQMGGQQPPAGEGNPPFQANRSMF